MMTEDAATGTLELRFDDFADLSSRLMLLPADDVQCVGAVIASYEEPPTPRENGSKRQTKFEEGIENAIEGKITDDEENKENEKKLNGVVGNEEQNGESKAQLVPLLGSILAGVKSLSDNVEAEKKDDDWYERDFELILSTVRATPAPFVLSFRPPPKIDDAVERGSGIGGVFVAAAAVAAAQSFQGIVSGLTSQQDKSDGFVTAKEEEDDDYSIDLDEDEDSTDSKVELADTDEEKCLGVDDTETESGAIQEGNHENNESTKSKEVSIMSSPSATELRGRLSRWGNIVSKTTSQLAAETKLRASALSEKASQAAADARERRKTAQAVAAAVAAAEREKGDREDAETGKGAERKETISGEKRCNGESSSLREKPQKDRLESQLRRKRESCGLYMQNSSGKFIELLSPNDSIINDTINNHKQDGVNGHCHTRHHQLPRDGRPPPIPTPGTAGIIPSSGKPTMRRSESGSSIGSMGSSGDKTTTPSKKKQNRPKLSWGVGSSPATKPRQKLIVNNSSLLLVRLSPGNPCPSQGYTFQWYRSQIQDSRINTDEPSRRSSFSDDSHNDNLSIDSELDCSEEEGGGSFLRRSRKRCPQKDDFGEEATPLVWFPLPNAVHPAFQPSATDVGHRIRCIVTVRTQTDDEYDSSDSANADLYTITCDLPHAISADSSLFNVARQGFASGRASYGNISGRGPSEGRTFRINVEIGRGRGGEKKRRGSSSRESQGSGGDVTDTCSLITIFQVSGSTAEPIHDEPIENASAVADPSQPSCFELFFPHRLPQSAGMVSALSIDENGDGYERLQLRAPNRVARESFLLALGIANFRGKPAQLTSDTMLFPLAAPSLISTEETIIRENSTPERSATHIAANGHSTSMVDGVGMSCQDTSSQLSQSITNGETPDKTERTINLEKDVHLLKDKLAAKDDIIANLRRRLERAESDHRQTQNELSKYRSDLNQMKAKYGECHKLQRLAEKRIETHESTIVRIKGDFASRIASFEDEIQKRQESEGHHEKALKSLENEKAVLSAAVEVRDGKLLRMTQLQDEVNKLRSEAARSEGLQRELGQTVALYTRSKADLEGCKNAQKDLLKDLNEAKGKIEQVNARLRGEQQRSTSYRADMESTQSRFQKLKAERNSFRQRADSLSREMSRVCRNGVGIAEIEKALMDYDAMKTEISLLRTQKRKALEELSEYRTAYEQSVQAQRKAGIDGEAMRALEQKAELERVVSELTEYVNAKEMQLETLMEVNRTLSEELRQSPPSEDATQTRQS